MDELSAHWFHPGDADRLKAVLDRWHVPYTERSRWWFWRQVTITGKVPAGAMPQLRNLFADVIESEQAW